MQNSHLPADLVKSLEQYIRDVVREELNKAPRAAAPKLASKPMPAKHPVASTQADKMNNALPKAETAASSKPAPKASLGTARSFLDKIKYRKSMVRG